MSAVRAIWRHVSGRAAQEAAESERRFRAVLEEPSPLLSESVARMMKAADDLCREVRESTCARDGCSPADDMASCHHEHPRPRDA